MILKMIWRESFTTLKKKTAELCCTLFTSTNNIVCVAVIMCSFSALPD